MMSHGVPVNDNGGACSKNSAPLARTLSSRDDQKLVLPSRNRVFRRASTGVQSSTDSYEMHPQQHSPKPFFRRSSTCVQSSMDCEVQMRPPHSNKPFFRRLSALASTFSGPHATTTSSSANTDDNDREELCDGAQKQMCFGNKQVGFSIHKFGKERAAEGNWEEAVLAWQNALEIFKEEYGEKNAGTIKLHRKIGFGHLKLGNLTYAFDSFQEAVRLTKEIGLERNEELEFAVEELRKVLSHQSRRASQTGVTHSDKEKVEHMFLSVESATVQSH